MIPGGKELVDGQVDVVKGLHVLLQNAEIHILPREEVPDGPVGICSWTILLMVGKFTFPVFRSRAPTVVCSPVRCCFRTSGS